MHPVHAPFLLPFLAFARPALAQDPAVPWRVVETDHYRVIYPVDTEEWALETASRLESVRERVVPAVGAPVSPVVDVVVLDPIGQANGFALPLLRSPRMGVFPTAPGAEGGLGNYRSWAEDLTVHEDVHLVHLLRPSRNPWVRAGTALLGVGPVALLTPTWAVEGLATRQEGLLTGAGRPNGDLRATLLRVLAREDRLPAWGALNGSDAFYGRSYPYLVGSAWLDWLALRQGPDAERALWARLTAVTPRGFSRAFTGAFGDTPEALYDRFRAETTWAAIAADRARPPEEGTLWQELDRGTGAPAVSSDGTRLAVVEARKTGVPRIVVFDLQDDGEAERKWQEAVDRALARDPEDVAPLKPRYFGKKRVMERVVGGRAPTDLRWLPGGHTLVFTAWVRRGRGEWRPELFSLDADRGRVRRITRRAGVSQADPHPDGTWAVAVRRARGACQLVRVDLSSGTVRDLASPDLPPPDIRTVLDTPRMSPDGTRLVYLRHQGSWTVVVRDLASGAVITLPLPEAALPAEPAWRPDGGAVYASVGLGGFVEVWELPVDGGPPRVITRTAGGALSPAPTPDGQALFFLSLHPGGLDLHRLALPAAGHEEPVLPADLFPVIRPPPSPPVPPLEVRPLPESRPYGAGRAETRLLVAGSVGEGMGSSEGGVRVGDLLGRWNVLFRGVVGDGAARSGGAVDAVVRRLPVDLQLHGFGGVAEGGATVWGGDLGFAWERVPDASDLAFRAGGRFGTVDGTTPRGAGFLEARLARRAWLRDAWVDLEGTAAGLVEAPPSAGRVGRAGGRLAAGLDAFGLAATADVGVAGGGAAVSVGGLRDGLLPGSFELDRRHVPALAPGTFQGPSWTAVSAEAGVPGAAVLFLERVEAGDRPFGEAEGATLTGLSLSLGSPAQPLARLAALGVETGVACILARPGRDVQDAPCTREGDWSAWLSLRWSP